MLSHELSGALKEALFAAEYVSADVRCSAFDPGCSTAWRAADGTDAECKGCSPRCTATGTFCLEEDCAKELPPLAPDPAGESATARLLSIDREGGGCLLAMVLLLRLLNEGGAVPSDFSTGLNGFFADIGT